MWIYRTNYKRKTTCREPVSPGAGGGEPKCVARRFVALAAAVGFLSFALAAQGQSSAPIGVDPGASIRFQILGDSLFRSGILSRLTRDSLIVERCPTCYGRLDYGRGELTRLDVSRRLAGGSRALTGFAIGASAGLGIGWLSGINCKGGDKCDGTIVAIPFLGILGGLIGGAAGYLSAYKWEPVSLSR